MNAQPKIRFSAIGLNHGHIYGQVEVMLRAGAELVSFYAGEPELHRVWKLSTGPTGEDARRFWRTRGSRWW